MSSTHEDKHLHGDPFRDVRNEFRDIIDTAKERKFLTLVYVLDMASKKVLLGHKARGFGMGKWNSMGGKFDPDCDPTIAHSAARELLEECNLQISHEKLKHDAVLYFQYPEHLQKKLFEVHLFLVKWHDVPTTVVTKSIDGDGKEQEQHHHNVPKASEEMNPVQWFDAHLLPHSIPMWKDDDFWLEPYLAKKFVDSSSGDESNKNNNDGNPTFVAAFDFEDYSTVRKQRVKFF